MFVIFVCTRLRMNSHCFEIESGRHTNPITLREDRPCTKCNVIEDEQHFLLFCEIYTEERKKIMSKNLEFNYNFNNMPPPLLYVKLLKSDNPIALSALGKFVYNSFGMRIDFKC